MSHAATSAKVFALYLFVLGSMLVVAPNLLLTSFGVPPTTEVWIRLLGVLVVIIGVFTWVAARHEDRHFFVASVYSRMGLFGAITLFVIFQLASPMLLLFGVVDLLGGLWSHLALRADARSPRVASAARPSQRAG